MGVNNIIDCVKCEEDYWLNTGNNTCVLRIVSLKVLQCILDDEDDVCTCIPGFLPS